MKEPILIILGIVVGLIVTLSVVVGLGDTWSARDSSVSMHPQTESGCVYKSYASRYNPFYRGVCELFRDRTFSK